MSRLTRTLIPDPWRPALRTARRRLHERVGSDKHSHLSLFDIDRRLDELIGLRGGVFVEAGANDGLNQSNTYFLERFRGWSGLLVEPVPHLAERCRRNRPDAVVAECALVAPDHDASTVPLRYADLMTLVPGALGSSDAEDAHVGLGEQLQAIESFDLDVPARTLDSLLLEYRLDRVDLLSLDVEGFEVEALRGLELDRLAPAFVLVEILDEARFDTVAAVLGDRYALRGRITHHDYLFAAHAD